MSFSGLFMAGGGLGAANTPGVPGMATATGGAVPAASSGVGGGMLSSRMSTSRPTSDLDLALEAIGKGLLGFSAGLQDQKNIDRMLQAQGARVISGGGSQPMTQVQNPGLLGLQNVLAGAGGAGGQVRIPSFGGFGG